MLCNLEKYKVLKIATDACWVPEHCARTRHARVHQACTVCPSSALAHDNIQDCNRSLLGAQTLKIHDGSAFELASGTPLPIGAVDVYLTQTSSQIVDESSRILTHMSTQTCHWSCSKLLHTHHCTHHTCSLGSRNLGCRFHQTAGKQSNGLHGVKSDTISLLSAARL